MTSSINIEAFNCVFREISASVHEKTQARDIARVVLERAARVLNAKGALVRTLNLETNESDLAVAYGVSERFCNKGPVLSSKALKGLSEDDVRIIADVGNDPRIQLTGIPLYSSNLMKKVPEQGPVQEALDVIIREARRCKDIIQDLLEFSRDEEPNKVLAHINEAIEKALGILENEFRLRHISVEKDLSSDMPKVLLDVNLMQQVFMNILLNAVEAIEENGVITVTSRLIPKSERLVIEIGDTGCGIQPGDMSKIFEPFFSTKRNGTGLGLAVSYGIIKKHRGNIQVSNQPGQGTRFSIEIPLTH